jgi:hypothetical protein
LLACAALIPTARADDPVPPQIQNLVVTQRPGTFFVDISYNLVDPDSAKVMIMVEATSTGGDPYLLPIASLSGDLGQVTPDTNKKIVWNAWDDWAGNFTNTTRIRIIADDTASAYPPPPTEPPSRRRPIWRGLPRGHSPWARPKSISPTPAGRLWTIFP